MLVALTKCDVPGARPQEVRAELLAEGLELVDAGGNIQAYIYPLPFFTPFHQKMWISIRDVTLAACHTLCTTKFLV